MEQHNLYKVRVQFAILYILLEQFGECLYKFKELRNWKKEN